MEAQQHQPSGVESLVDLGANFESDPLKGWSILKGRKPKASDIDTSHLKAVESLSKGERFSEVMLYALELCALIKSEDDNRRVFEAICDESKDELTDNRREAIEKELSQVLADDALQAAVKQKVEDLAPQAVMYQATAEGHGHRQRLIAITKQFEKAHSYQLLEALYKNGSIGPMTFRGAGDIFRLIAAEQNNFADVPKPVQLRSVE